MASPEQTQKAIATLRDKNNHRGNPETKMRNTRKSKLLSVDTLCGGCFKMKIRNQGNGVEMNCRDNCDFMSFVDDFGTLKVEICDNFVSNIARKETQK